MKRWPLVAFVTVLLVSPSAAASLGFTVAPTDEPAGAAYTWREAVDACEDKGMALPSLEEMAQIYCHAGLERKNVVPEYPQADKGCAASGVSGSLPNFRADARYWTASRYNDGVVRYIDFFDGKIGYYGKDERLRVRCILPDKNDAERRTRVFPYDINDVDEQSFEYIIDTIADLHADLFARHGKQLVIRKQWTEEEENARSWFMEVNDREADRVRQVREIELVGGLARHPMLNRDAFALVVCHEMGHHVGGAPLALGYSSEGQSDYFAAARCMKRYLKVVRYDQPYREPLPEAVAARCAAAYAGATERAICRRTILAGLTLSRWIAHSREVGTTDLLRPDPERRASTLVHGYPSPQCRLDTLVAGALCPIDDRVAFSDDDAGTGACNDAAGARPACWFNAGETGARAARE